MPEEEPLNIADVSCPVCLSIEVEPVTMPCSHSICKTCFTDTVLIANKECPLCRTRIASWARRATREGTLVNQRLWERIQEAFPDEVARRLRGEDDTSVFEEDPYRHLSGPGEIREEYERALQREVQEYLRQRSAEELAGQELARRLAEEERLALEEQQRRELMDARLAGLLANLDDSALFNEAVLGASLRTPSLTANLATIQDGMSTQWVSFSAFAFIAPKEGTVQNKEGQWRRCDFKTVFLLLGGLGSRLAQIWPASLFASM